MQTASPHHRMTLRDLSILLAGTSIGLVLIPQPRGVTWLRQYGWSQLTPEGIWISCVNVLGLFLLALNVGAASVVLVRVVTRGLVPRPGEWLAILVALLALRPADTFVDDLIFRLSSLIGDPRSIGLVKPAWTWTWIDFKTIKPPVEPESLILIALGPLTLLLALAGYGRLRGSWIRMKVLTLMFVSWLLIWLTSPLVLRTTVWLINRRLIRPEISSIRRSHPLTWTDLLLFFSGETLGLIPIGVLFAVPFLLTLRSLFGPHRRPLTWVESFSLASSLIFISFRVLDFLPGLLIHSISPLTHPGQLHIWSASYTFDEFRESHNLLGFSDLILISLTRLTLLLWAVLVLLLSRFLIPRLDPSWNRWLGLVEDRSRTE